MEEEAEKAASSSMSLTDKFKKVNHIRHWLMDISMFGMAIGALVATGGATGFLDPVIGWIKMHFVGIPELFSSGPDFLAAASEGFNQGMLYVGTDVSHAAMHSVAPGVDVVNNAVQDALTGSGLPAASAADYQHLLENHPK